MLLAKAEANRAGLGSGKKQGVLFF